MATLLLTAVGTLVGGPLGGAIGALAGRSIDGALLGGGRREGPRLKELALTTSSYGQPIPRQHGRMRAGGTIIWATDLVEHKEKTGGKKGQPSATTYAYTTSFAVALSSRPILGVGRIWADGNLLRGAAGDLKVGGALRIHTGHGDQAPDPLIAAANGDDCPAFRDCAYAVFEDLALSDFGNRIPALTFEVMADDGSIALADLVNPLAADVSADAALGPLAGFANEGGPLISTLETIDTLFPLACDAGGDKLTIAAAATSDGAALPLLPASARGWDEDDFGSDDGRRDDRAANDAERPEALRYYDIARDYQPGVQRPAGRAGSGRERTIEFPGAFAAEDARGLATDAARRSAWQRDRLMWRLAELDPSLVPGMDVRVPGRPGIWRIDAWEWRLAGVELELTRRNPLDTRPAAADSGALPLPADIAIGETILVFYELPQAGPGPDQPALFAAATSAGAAGRAALFIDRAGGLVPLAQSSRANATIGSLAAPLGASPGLVFEPRQSLDVVLDGQTGSFAPSSIARLALGANRLLVGGEVLQFAQAEQTAPNRWRLTGLLRGRGGTEASALAGHTEGTRVVLLDDAPVALDPAVVPSDPTATIAAIGLADEAPVYATLANPGLSRRPLCPVHPRAVPTEDGGLALAWTRRARGAWLWLDEVETPLVEQEERYLIGAGPVGSPHAQWTASVPELTLSAATLASLIAAQPGAPLWVRQVGSFAQSDPLLLTHLS